MARFLTDARALNIVMRVFEKNKSADSVARVFVLCLKGVFEDGWDIGYKAGLEADGHKRRADQAEEDLNNLVAKMKERGWRL